jgi:hypothetical protein
MVFQLPVQEVRVVPASVQVISHLGIPSPPVTIMAEHVFFSEKKRAQARSQTIMAEEVSRLLR